MTRIALIHALAHSMAPIHDAFERQWPRASRMNLLDDSLSLDRARGGRSLDAAMTARFHALADYAIDAGAVAILFTCSAFGPCIDAVARRHAGLPVLKPNEAMIAEAAAAGRRVGLVATFAPTLESMPAEFPAGVEVRARLAIGALDALDRGDAPTHDRLIAEAAQQLAADGCEVIALAQYSMARAATTTAGVVGAPVLTAPDSAVRALMARLVDRDPG